MAAVKSDQITNADAVPQVLNKTYDANKVVGLYFHYNNASGSTLAIASTIDLVKIPAGVRILPNSAMFNKAMSSVTIDLGYPAHTTPSGTAVVAAQTAFQSAKSMTSAAMTNFDAGNENGYVTTGEMTLQATVGGAVFPTTGWISGVVFYVAA